MLWKKKKKKKEKKKNKRGNKKGQVPGASKEKKKSETRGKNGQVSDSRIRGTGDLGFLRESYKEFLSFIWKSEKTPEL